MRTITNTEYEFDPNREGDRKKFSITWAFSNYGGRGNGRWWDGKSTLSLGNVPDTSRRLGGIAAQGEFNDEDGVPVSFTINLDSDGWLFELDLWRVDFEQLKRFPTENDEVKMLVDTA